MKNLKRGIGYIFIALMGLYASLPQNAPDAQAGDGSSPEESGGNSATPTPTSTPTVTPTPTPQVCSVYSYSFEEAVGIGPNGEASRNTALNATREPGLSSFNPELLWQLNNISNAAIRTRFDNWFRGIAASLMSTHYDPIHDITRRNNTDDTFMWHFWDLACQECGTACFVPRTNPRDQVFNCGGGPTTYVPQDFQRTSFPDGRDLNIYTFYISAITGRVIPRPSILSDLCDLGRAWIIDSPISLIFDDRHDINSDLRIVSFPINPNRKGSVYTWKASARAPLLVWDPEHTGNITSGDQLFGNWTFGGRKTASLNIGVTSDISSPLAPAPWIDGYEALGSLDVDGDGEVSGDELTSLGLWFDKNQDGVSDKGEVRPVYESGVRRIFYKGAELAKNNRDLELLRGYERKINDRIVQGRSVDWYAGTGSQASSVLGPLFSGVSGAPYSNPSLQVPEPRALVEEKPSKNTLELAKKVQGAWRWSIELPNGRRQPVGYFVFAGIDGGLVKGSFFNLFEIPKPVNASSVQSGNFFISAVSASEGKFSFSVPQGGFVESRIKIDKSRTILGRSKGTTTVGRQKVAVSYKWVAEPLDLKK